jgi:Glycosyltransferase family 87
MAIWRMSGDAFGAFRLRMKAWLESLSLAGRLGRVEQLLLWLLAALILIFSVLAVDHQALQGQRKGDLGVFLRAAWAARTGTSLYRITDDHGWHYHYPPLLAGLLIPLADPPPTTSPLAPARPPALPYWLSSAIWYWFNICCLVVALHLVASALEKHLSHDGVPPWPRLARGWWALRAWPLLVFLLYVGDSLGKGQLTVVLLLCLSVCAANLLGGRSMQAGVWLGIATGLKIFPVYLLIYPALRGGKRFLVGAGLAIALGLLLPFAILGPKAAVTAYRELIYDRLLGEAVGDINQRVAQEMHGTNARIQSFEYIIYHLQDPAGDDLESVPPRLYFLIHIAVSFLLTIAALLSMRRRADALGEFLFFASLALLVVPISPVPRPHYYALGTLAVAGIVAHEWPRRRGIWLGWRAAAVLLAMLVIEIAVVTEQRQLVDFGAATFAALALAAFCIAAGRNRVDMASHNVGKARAIR